MSGDKADLTPTAHEVKVADRNKNIFDGQKVDLFINTGKLGKTFLIKVHQADGKPVLVAMHL
jgi:hypothetical protein